MGFLIKGSLEQGGNPIAPCEAAMIPLVMLQCLPRFIDRQVIMFVDNSVLPFAMVNGSSNLQAVARSSQLTGFWG